MVSRVAPGLLAVDVYVVVEHEAMLHQSICEPLAHQYNFEPFDVKPPFAYTEDPRLDGELQLPGEQLWMALVVWPETVVP